MVVDKCKFTIVCWMALIDSSVLSLSHSLQSLLTSSLECESFVSTQALSFNKYATFPDASSKYERAPSFTRYVTFSNVSTHVCKPEVDIV